MNTWFAPFFQFVQLLAHAFCKPFMMAPMGGLEETMNVGGGETPSTRKESGAGSDFVDDVAGSIQLAGEPPPPADSAAAYSPLAAAHDQDAQNFMKNVQTNQHLENDRQSDQQPEKILQVQKDHLMQKNQVHLVVHLQEEVEKTRRLVSPIQHHRFPIRLIPIWQR